MYTMMSLLFLLLGVVLIASIVMSLINPYDQVTFANVEKLRASMNQACATDNDVSIKFSLPQNTPSLTGIIQVLPIWLINTNGDPNYVLYYESFPPGEAIGWEVYQHMQNRLVAYLPEGSDGKNEADVLNYAKEAMNKANEKGISTIEGIVIGNIVIGEKRSDFFVGEKAGGAESSANAWQERAKESAAKYGAWDNKAESGEPLPGDNYFKFNSYVTLNNFEKSSIKYESCGDNSLCLKTRTGVYRFPLSQCQGIKGVQMVYDARDRTTAYGVGVAAIACVYTSVCAAAVGGVGSIGTWLSKLSWITKLGALIPRTLVTGGKVVVGGTAGVGASIGVNEAAQWLGGAFLSYKTQDFNIASPCEIKEMTITKAKCVSDIPISFMDNQKACAAGSVVKHTIYQYGNDGKLHVAGDHYTCTEKVNEEVDTVRSDPYDNRDDCLQIKVVEKASGFCWTPDPYKDVWRITSDTQLIARSIGLTPVYDTLSYLKITNDGYAFVLKQYEIGKLESWHDWLERKFGWGWPG